MHRLVALSALPLLALASSQPLFAAGTLTRTFVSAAGNDSNPCTISQPCATFAAAYAAVAPSGVIAALDPGKYGPLTITGPVTINGNGWAAITAPAASNGITVNAGSGAVVLNGLEVDGANAGYNGIVLTSGANVAVSNCILQNFVQSSGDVTRGNGILIAPSSNMNFTITDTTVSNSTNGIEYHPPGSSPAVNGVIDRVLAAYNQGGLTFDGTATAGGATTIAVSNTLASNNGTNGVTAEPGFGTLTLAMDSIRVSGNTNGIVIFTTTSASLGRSVVTGNSGIGVFNDTSPNTFYTYNNNEIDLNSGGDITGTALSPKPLH